MKKKTEGNFPDLRDRNFTKGKHQPGDMNITPPQSKLLRNFRTMGTEKVPEASKEKNAKSSGNRKYNTSGFPTDTLSEPRLQDSEGNDFPPNILLMAKLSIR